MIKCEGDFLKTKKELFHREKETFRRDGLSKTFYAGELYYHLQAIYEYIETLEKEIDLLKAGDGAIYRK